MAHCAPLLGTKSQVCQRNFLWGSPNGVADDCVLLLMEDKAKQRGKIFEEFEHDSKSALVEKLKSGLLVVPLLG